MEVDFTKEQYEQLIRLVYLGNWVINSIRSGRPGDERIKKFDNAAGYVYSFGKDFGLEKYVDFDEDSARFFPSAKLEGHEKVEEYITEYENDAFWYNLTTRLSARDLMGKYGEEAVKKMEPEKRRNKHRSLEKKYIEEFRQNGLENLKIAE